MSMGIQLNPRLQVVAELVRPHVRLADIGTDHAYLPIALLLRGTVTSAIAADLREGPLAHARKNAMQYQVMEQLSLRCCNGLSDIAADEVDDIVIAGMGGELIAEILAAAPWTKDETKHLVLQAMSSAEDLRRYLYQESFYIESEVAVRDNGRVYTVISAYYSKTKRNERTAGFDYIGCLDVNASKEAQEFALRQLRHLAKILQGQQLRDDLPQIERTLAEIRGIEARFGRKMVVFSGDIYDELDRFAPFHTAMSFDNVGILVGSRNRVVTKALLALDITPAVIQEAVKIGAELIISHHPVIFDPVKRFTDTHPAYMLAKYHITAICAHTNLDMAEGGVNTCLAEVLGLTDCKAFAYYENCAEGLIGTLPMPVSPLEFATAVRDQLGCGSVQYTDGGRPICHVALCSGSGGDLLRQAHEAGADAFVTGEARHHQLLEAQALGMTMVVAGHHRTECVVLPPLQKRLQQAFAQVEFELSEVGIDPTLSI